MRTPVAGEVCVLFVAFVLTVSGTSVYRSFALRHGLVARPNARSLHSTPTACGGGVVFALVVVAMAGCLFVIGVLDSQLLAMLTVGGGVALTFGFVDDVYNVGQAEKLVTQAVLAALIMFFCSGRPFLSLPWSPMWLSQMFSWCALIWLMNLYNFIDGIDGLAGSGAVYLCTLAIVLLVMRGVGAESIAVFALLAVCVSGFLMFNWPPATIFMGDSGSLFLGYVFGALLSWTVAANELSAWTWVTAFGYFLGDTATTTLLRIATVDHFYRPHRSHAYQNLARIWGSHRRVVLLVAGYHLVWLVPLSVVSVLRPAAGWLTAICGVVPAVLWTLKFGPRLSGE